MTHQPPLFPGIDTSRAIQGDEKDVARRRAQRAASRDVDIPPVADPARRDASAHDLRRFLETYFPATFYLPWSRDQLEEIRDTQAAILTGGKTAKVAPRGDGKTSRARGAILWSLLYGHRRFAFLLCDTYPNAVRNGKILRRTVETNDLLFADFPGPCACARALAGAYNRSGTQTTVLGAERVRTHIQWGGGLDNMLIFPTLPDEASSGAVLSFGGLDGALRGLNHMTPDGRTLRPDLLFCDDPQERKHARNPRITEDRIRIILDDVLPMAPPDNPMTVIYRGTIIAEADMTAQFADRKRYPDWRGVVKRYWSDKPSAAELWTKYDDLRIQSLEKHEDIRLATAFYKNHQATCRIPLDESRPCAECRNRPNCMDADCVVSNPHRHYPHEASAVQHGMNIILERGESAFETEYQNRPPPAEEDVSLVLDSWRVEHATSGLERGIVPNTALALVAGCDVNKFGLHWAVLAASPGRIGTVVDYGVQEIDAPVGRIGPDDREKRAALETAILAGLRRLREKLDTPFTREDGHPATLTLGLIDSRWMTQTVDAFCAEAAPHWFAVMGCGTTKHMPKFRPPKAAQLSRDSNCYVKIEELTDPHTRKRTGQRRRFFAHADAYKQALHAGFFLDPEEPGAVRLFDTVHRKDHHSFARHLTAEMQIEKAPGTYVWDTVRGRADNHWLDATYLTLCACSILEHRLPALAITGIAEAAETDAPAPETPKPKSKHKQPITEVPL